MPADLAVLTATPIPLWATISVAGNEATRGYREVVWSSASVNSRRERRLPIREDLRASVAENQHLRTSNGNGSSLDVWSSLKRVTTNESMLAGNVTLEDAELIASVVGHTVGGPGGIHYDFDLDFAHAFQRRHDLLAVGN